MPDANTPMRAILFRKYGPPEELRLGSVPRPVPKANEILVRVLATTVNRTDCGVRKAEPWLVRLFAGLVRPKQPVLGNELAGEVEAVGADVTAFRVGDRVCGLTGDAFGAHADYVCLPQDAAVVPMPTHLRPDEATTIGDGPWLALTCLRTAGLVRGQHILVYGASGSIGTSAVQLARHLGARVTAVCATKHVELVTSLGAHDVVDYTQTDFTRIGRTFDVVLDAVGKSTFAACRRLLTPRGIYVSTDLGPWWQNPILQLWTGVVGGKKVAVAVPDARRARSDVEMLRELFETKELRPVIDRTYPLERIVEAHRYVDTEQKVGSVVVLVAAGRATS